MAEPALRSLHASTPYLPSILTLSLSAPILVKGGLQGGQFLLCSRDTGTLLRLDIRVN